MFIVAATCATRGAPGPQWRDPGRLVRLPRRLPAPVTPIDVIHAPTVSHLVRAAPAPPTVDYGPMDRSDEPLPPPRFAGLDPSPEAEKVTVRGAGRRRGGHGLDIELEGPADGPVVLLLHGEPTWS